MSSLLNNSRFRASYIDPHVFQILEYCRDSYTHTHARELVPVSELVQDNLDILDDDNCYQDRLLPLVCDWFKTSFFSWFKAPNCERCSSELNCSSFYTNCEEKRVEVYSCPQSGCDYNYEFIRHNDPAILLHTRTGRCGEWATCFLVILRSLDYHARIVYDSTDHVWNEVWSEPRRRWIHVDPCEGVVDAPLIYEAGWKKKLVYCLAIGQYEVLDVTGRYVLDFSDTRTRRTQCEEGWLTIYLQNLTEDLLKNAPNEDVMNQIRSRRAMDVERLRELMSRPQVVPDKSRIQGRTTGGIEWRLSRGEYSVSSKNHAVIAIRSNDSSSTVPALNLRYNSLKNCYECNDERYRLKGWSSLVYEYENIDYKYETDWKTSYLSRYESCPPSKEGKIRWRFDLSSLNRKFAKLEIVMRGKIYPDTNINLSLSTRSCENSEEALETMQFRLNEPLVIDKIDEDVKYLDLSATLSGGDENDDVAWQKPQLFRQTQGSGESDEWSFSFKIF